MSLTLKLCFHITLEGANGMTTQADIDALDVTVLDITVKVKAGTGGGTSPSIDITKLKADIKALDALVSGTTTPGTFALTADSAVAAGNTLNGSVTIPTAAPSGGTTVTLATSDPSIPVPASVVVPEGALSATFSVTTVAPAASPATVTLTAFLPDGTSTTATVVVN